MSNHTNHEAKLESQFKSLVRAESPTTVKPFDMDDDEVPEPAVGVIETPNLSGIVKLDNDPPNQQSPQAPQPTTTSDLNAEETLKEAFSSIDLAVVKAVLRASGGQIEPAFNALLGMSDPKADQELSNNPLPLQPLVVTGVGSTPLSQLEADERYARQLANQYRYSDRSAAIGSPRNNSRGELAQGSGQSQNIHEERSFLEDDLPIIKDNLKKGFLETQNKVSNWITLLKKKIDGDDDDDDDTDQNHVSTSRVNKFNDDGRKSDDFSPYDADPQVLGDDFAGIQMHSDGTLASHTYKADKSYPKSLPILSKTPYDYHNSTKTNPQKENDSFKTSSNYETKIASKQSKWQPLSTVKPNPVSEADNDPFSLGDSDDEKEIKDCVPGIEVKPSIAEAQDKSSPRIKNDNILESESNRFDTAIVPEPK